MNEMQELKKMLTDINSRIKSVNNELAVLPKGSLNVENRRGRPVPVHTKYEQGKRIRTSLLGNIDIQAKLLRAEFLQEELQCLEHNKLIIEKAIAQCKPYNFESRLHETEIRLKCDVAELLSHYFRTYDKISTWAAEYAPTDYRSSERRHVTSRGLYVRSKSEVLIAEKLYEYSISFRYEQPVIASDITLHPDFTIMRKDGKMFYWEHLGLTNSQKYLDLQNRKTQLYASIDIVPWDNLIITYDNADGIIDLRIVESEIKNKLYVP